LSTILTAIYATLNVAGAIGVFRSNQEYSHPMDRKLFVERNGFAVGGGGIA
jgi:hypothetical protein